MSETGKSFTADDARLIGEEIGINWATSPFDVKQFRIGMNVELEHGLHDMLTNVSDDDLHVTAKIVWVPGTPFGTVARARAVDAAWIAERAAAQSIVSARPSISVSPTMFHARAQLPDRAEFGKGG